MTYILDDAGNPVVEPDMIKWAKWFEEAQSSVPYTKRHIALDTIGNVKISTVFLSIDHNFTDEGSPILWETMVFGGPLDEEQARYTDKATALAGHAAMVKRVRAEVPKGDGIAYDDLPPINMTDGVSASEHVERVRDAKEHPHLRKCLHDYCRDLEDAGTTNTPGAPDKP